MNKIHDDRDVNSISIFLCLQDIWKEKKIVMLSVLIGTFMAVFYAFNIDETWESKAIIQAPSYAQTVITLSDISELYSIVGKNNKKELNNLLSSKELLKTFEHNYSSFEIKKRFMEGNKYFIGNKKSLTEQEINHWVNNIKLYSLGNGGIVLSFITKSPKDSKMLLSEYIKFISKISFDSYISTVKAISSQELIFNRNLLKMYKDEAKRDLDIALNKAKYALLIANAANQIKPITKMNKEMFSIDLGSKGLTEKISLLKNENSYIFFDKENEIGKISYKIKTLEGNDNKIESLSFFDYIQHPIVPLSKLKPKRILIIVMAFIFSLFIGGGLALIKASYYKNK